MLRQRVLSAAVFIPILFVCIWFGNPWFSIIVAIAALIGIIEFYSIFSKERWRPLTFFGTIWTLFFIVNAYYANSYNSDTTRILATYGLMASVVVISFIVILYQRIPRENTFYSWAWSVAGVFYIGWLLGYWILIMNSGERYGWDGRDWVLLALFSTFAVDTTAYFVGRAFGRHKMAPAISPGKTWEGAIGGLLGGVAISGIFESYQFFRGITRNFRTVLEHVSRSLHDRNSHGIRVFETFLSRMHCPSKNRSFFSFALFHCFYIPCDKSM